MTVAEAIEKLKQMPQDAILVSRYDDEWSPIQEPKTIYAHPDAVDTSFTDCSGKGCYWCEHSKNRHYKPKVKVVEV